MRRVSLPILEHTHVPTFTVLHPTLLCRSHHLRQRDREKNGINFPNLYYPELYLLHGGYKAMFTAVEAKAATAVSTSLIVHTHSSSDIS